MIHRITDSGTRIEEWYRRKTPLFSKAERTMNEAWFEWELGGEAGEPAQRNCSPDKQKSSDSGKLIISGNIYK